MSGNKSKNKNISTRKHAFQFFSFHLKDFDGKYAHLGTGRIACIEHSRGWYWTRAEHCRDLHLPHKATSPILTPHSFAHACDPQTTSLLVPYCVVSIEPSFAVRVC